MAYHFALVTDEPGWHGARLREAFAARGHACRMLSLHECSLTLQPGVAGVHLPGFEAALPDGVFVRGVPGGSLEEVVFCLDILHALALLGVPVYNDGRAIERSVDKAMTSFLLHRAGVPTAPTRVFREPLQAWAWLLQEQAAGHQVVSKPLFGSQGEGLLRLGRADDLPDREALNGVFYLQRYIDTGEGAWHDWRVFVIAGTAVAAMRRNGTSWVTNVARGARCQAALLGAGLGALAEHATEALGMAYAGVDILRDRHGVCWVVEVNGIPAWRGLQEVCQVDLAAALVDDFVARVDAAAALEAAG